MAVKEANRESWCGAGWSARHFRKVEIAGSSPATATYSRTGPFAHGPVRSARDGKKSEPGPARMSQPNAVAVGGGPREASKTSAKNRVRFLTTVLRSARLRQLVERPGLNPGGCGFD